MHESFCWTYPCRVYQRLCQWACRNTQLRQAVSNAALCLELPIALWTMLSQDDPVSAFLRRAFKAGHTLAASLAIR